MYGGMERVAEPFVESLRSAKPLDNDYLCHGYTGQIWAREKFDQAFGSSTRKQFESVERSHQLFNRSLDQLITGTLSDLSLFNGLFGPLAVLGREKKMLASPYLFPVGMLTKHRGFNSPVHKDLGVSEGVKNLLR